MTDRYCCHPTCDFYAEFEIVTQTSGGGIAGPDPYSDFTDGCSDHIGYLLGFQGDIAPEKIPHVEWLVIPIDPEKSYS